MLSGPEAMGVVAVLDHPEQASAMERVYTVEGGRIAKESIGGAMTTEAAD